jgi:hypothetical protein
MGYYLADGIYPEWATLVKTIQNPEGRAEAEFAKAQEAARKDIERAFGVLQVRFAIVRCPSHFWDNGTLHDIMTTCVILHNMIIDDEKHLNLAFFFDNIGICVKPSKNIKSKHFLKHSETLRTEPPTSSSRKISFDSIGVGMVVSSTTLISFHFIFIHVRYKYLFLL